MQIIYHWHQAEYEITKLHPDTIKYLASVYQTIPETLYLSSTELKDLIKVLSSKQRFKTLLRLNFGAKEVSPKNRNQVHLQEGNVFNDLQSLTVCQHKVNHQHWVAKHWPTKHTAQWYFGLKIIISLLILTLAGLIIRSHDNGLMMLSFLILSVIEMGLLMIDFKQQYQLQLQIINAIQHQQDFTLTYLNRMDNLKFN